MCWVLSIPWPRSSPGHAVGAVVLVDGAQSVPHATTDVVALDADFSPSAAIRCSVPRAWACSMANGTCWRPCRRSWAEEHDPARADRPFCRPTSPPDLKPAPRRSIGKPSASAAIDYLNAIGLDAIRQHEQLLTQRAHEILSAQSGVRIVGPGEAQRGNRQLRARPHPCP